MIVVSDTSPLNYLILINAIDVLPKLFDEIHAPPAVMAELQHARTPPAVKAWAQQPPPWLRITAPTKPRRSPPLLDPGEEAALDLAEELRAAAVLIDERKGRRIARERGFAAIGTLTVLELAARSGWVDLPAALSALQQTSFQVTQGLIDAALLRHANRPTP